MLKALHTAKQRMGLIGCALASCLCLNACMPTEDVNFERYTLTQDVDPSVYESKYKAEVKLAPILDQGGVVIQISDVSLRPAKNYRFSSQLSAELTVLLLNELQKTEINPRYSFTLYVTKFQGTLDGKVLVEALAQVTDSRRNRVVFSQSYFKEDTQKDDGYGSLVQSLKDNFIALTQELLVDFQAKQK